MDEGGEEVENDVHAMQAVQKRDGVQVTNAMQEGKPGR